MMRDVVIAIALLAAVPATAAEDHPVQRVKKWLWPHSVPPPLPGIGIGSPGEARVPPAEPVPLPKAAPVKKMAPPVKRARKVEDDDDDDRPVRRRVAPPVPCDQVALGMATIGAAEVRRQARARGHSDAAINRALRACGY